MLLGKAPKDIDIVTSATPVQTAEIFSDTQMVGAAFGVVLVKENGYAFEVATFREERNYLDGRRPEHVKYTENPEIDVKRRDFTVNGLLCNPENGEVLDFIGGVEDLNRGILRTIGDAEERFNEDYLRMLRAVRFAVRLGFEMEESTLNAIRKLAPKTAEIAAERVQHELTLIFTGERPHVAFDLLYDSGLMEVLLPEVAAMKGVTQPPEFHPEGDVFEHTRLMLEHMALPNELIAWSVLLHDVAKPVTRSVEENGRIRFFGHESNGAEMAEQILYRLRFSKNTIDRDRKSVV